jgi:tRNA1Val (adenine37-N6)-methyltransferase
LEPRSFIKCLKDLLMNDYAQPDFYRFNEDSILLVKFILSKVSKISSILDMGAGSGVMGIELSNILFPSRLVLIEAQEEWKPFLEKNLNFFLKSEIQSEIIISTFGQWTPDSVFDLIVCNPPYYLPGRGVRSPDSRRDIARSFVIDGWDILLNKISKVLADNGHGFIVVRRDEGILKELDRSSYLFDVKKYFIDHLVFIELRRLNINRDE